MERAAALFVAIAILPSCIFYDSRWGEAKRSQRAEARHAKPSELRATPPPSDEAPSRAPLRVVRVRAYATPRYSAEVVDWRRQLDNLVDDANAILASTLGGRLELVSAEAWTPRGSDDDLNGLLDELAAADPGRDVERVIGLAGSLPRYELSFHQLGLGRLLGKHLAMRAMNDVREYEAIRVGLSELDEKERQTLYAARKRHKMTAVLLHELGHTFGVPHEIDAHTIMVPTYGPHVNGFSANAAQLMRLSLAHELAPTEMSDQDFARAATSLVEGTASSWIASDRDALLARLSAIARRPASPRPVPSGAAPPVARLPRPRLPSPTLDPQLASVSPLTDADRATFAKAREQLRSGRADEAAATAKPLFTAYPNVYAVQDLRCQIAMKRSASLDAINEECKAVLSVVPTGVDPQPK